jgi:hypothetical protein
MAKNIENFRDQLGKLAKAVEILESTFVGEGDMEIKVILDEQTYRSLMSNLNDRNTNDNCTISIGSMDFTFLKK